MNLAASTKKNKIGMTQLQVEPEFGALLMYQLLKICDIILCTITHFSCSQMPIGERRPTYGNTTIVYSFFIV